MSQLSVLILGSGGREHALAWKIAQSPLVHQIYVAPGNGGTEWEAEAGVAACHNVPLELSEFGPIIQFAQSHKIGLTIVGPELPLAKGIVDRFQTAGLPIFGPTAKAAQLESSKAFAKQFMQNHQIPTASYEIFTQAPDAIAYLTNNPEKPLVVKASGLAAGKGVMMCPTRATALKAVHNLMEDRQFGRAGEEIVIEEWLQGKEISLLAFSDGKTVVPMLPARDHKRLKNNDQGPNTGGMGVFAPIPDASPQLIQQLTAAILQPAIDGMAAQNTPYIGILYAGLILTPDGPKLLEFNCRFGDPETEVLLPLLETDLVAIMLACLNGSLDKIEIKWNHGAAATIILAAPGYPNQYRRGLPITGISEANQLQDVTVFHAGTAKNDKLLISTGGRVLAVTGKGKTLAQAIIHAYEGVAKIYFPDAQFRTDIGRNTTKQSAYAQAGVNIQAGNEATRLMKDAVKSTYGPEVLSETGSFGGLFDIQSLKQLDHPVLVASTDGVGTKTKVASQMNRWDTIGQDLVNHCINDILVQGARPLFFLDYVAASNLDPQQISTIVAGVATACRSTGVALLGGETAEMPGVYEPNEIDLAGTIVGVVDKNKLWPQAVTANMAILALPSTGLHTNGFSLARKTLTDLDWHEPRPELKGLSIGDALLAVHRCYLSEISQLTDAQITIHALAHITGGGIVDNLPRVLPDEVGATIKNGRWSIPPIFTLIQKTGAIATEEMFHAFNMGVGMLLIIPQDEIGLAQSIVPELQLVGHTIAGSGVTFN